MRNATCARFGRASATTPCQRLILFFSLCLLAGCPGDVARPPKKHSNATVTVPSSLPAEGLIEQERLWQAAFFASPSERERISTVVRVVDATRRGELTERCLDSLREELLQPGSATSAAPTGDLTRRQNLALAASLLAITPNKNIVSAAVEQIKGMVRGESDRLATKLELARKGSPANGKRDESVESTVGAIVIELTRENGPIGNANEDLRREWAAFLRSDQSPADDRLARAIAALRELSSDSDSEFWDPLAWAVWHASPRHEISLGTLGRPGTLQRATEILLIFDLLAHRSDLTSTFLNSFAAHGAESPKGRNAVASPTERQLSLLLDPMLKGWQTASMYAEEWRRSGRPYLVRLKRDEEASFAPFVAHFVGDTLESAGGLQQVQFTGLGISASVKTSTPQFVQLERKVIKRDLAAEQNNPEGGEQFQLVAEPVPYLRRLPERDTQVEFLRERLGMLCRLRAVLSRSGSKVAVKQVQIAIEGSLAGIALLENQTRMDQLPTSREIEGSSDVDLKSFDGQGSHQVPAMRVSFDDGDTYMYCIVPVSSLLSGAITISQESDHASTP